MSLNSFKLGIKNNPLKVNLYTVDNSDYYNSNQPPSSGDFILLGGGDFNLLDNSNFLLLGE